MEARDFSRVRLHDSDNFDSEEITKRIVDILNAKKPCIIVINQKNASGNEIHDKEKILKIKEKIDGLIWYNLV